MLRYLTPSTALLIALSSCGVDRNDLRSAPQDDVQSSRDATPIVVIPTPPSTSLPLPTEKPPEPDETLPQSKLGWDGKQLLSSPILNVIAID